MAQKGKKRRQPQKESEVQLTFWQTLQLGFYGVPNFRKGLLLIAVGMIVAIATMFMEFNNTINFVAVIGALIAFTGFDQISKIVAGIRSASQDDYNRVVIQKEFDQMNAGRKKKK